jgi:hypothetical protein
MLITVQPFFFARFRPEAVNAIAALQADVVVLTEYYPQKRDNARLLRRRKVKR